EWVHVQLHQQKGMISLSPPTICNSADIADALTLQDASKGKSVRMKSITFDGICQSIGNLTLF
ncbi:hypothetical protein, partial [Escherichia coli]|uniref:hypothetical protein n=1 Tax=Escherichia coli TaxID=562 RepID=UPI001A7E08DD